MTAAFVRRPFCAWLCPVDAVERAARPLRASVLGVMRRRNGPSRPRRPILLAMTASSPPPTPVFRRLRNGLLTVVGLASALLVLGHFHERLGARGRDTQDGLLGRTFVSLDAVERAHDR